LLNIDNKIFPLSIWIYTAVTRLGPFKVNNNATITKWYFFADDRVSLKPLKREKGHGTKKFIAKFLTKSYTLSGQH